MHIALYCTALYCTVLHYIVLNYLLYVTEDRIVYPNPSQPVSPAPRKSSLLLYPNPSYGREGLDWSIHDMVDRQTDRKSWYIVYSTLFSADKRNGMERTTHYTALYCTVLYCTVHKIEDR